MDNKNPEPAVSQQNLLKSIINQIKSNQKKVEPYESLEHIINSNKKHNTTVQACFVLHYQPVYVPLTLIFFFPLGQQSQHDLGLVLLLLHEGLHQILLCAQLLSS